MPQCSSCNQSRWVYTRFGRFADELEWWTGFLPYGCLACGRRGWHRSRRTPRAVEEFRRAYPRLLRIPTAWRTPAMAMVARRPSGGWVVAFALGFGSGALVFSGPSPSLHNGPAVGLTRVEPTPVEPAAVAPRPVDPGPVEPPPVTTARVETPRADPPARRTTPASSPRAATARIEPTTVKRPDIKVATARDQRARQKAPAPAAPARRPQTRPAETPASPAHASAPPAQASVSPAPAPAPPAPAPAPTAPTATAASQDRPRFHGILEIHSEPLGALVSVDGRVVGATPLLLKAVPAGSRVLRIESDGYERWSFAARVVANQATRIVATLQRGSGH